MDPSPPPTSLHVTTFAVYITTTLEPPPSLSFQNLNFNEVRLGLYCHSGRSCRHARPDPLFFTVRVLDGEVAHDHEHGKHLDERRWPNEDACRLTAPTSSYQK